MTALEKLLQEATERPWRVGDAGHTVFGPPNGTPSPETIANVHKRAHARLIALAVNKLEALTGLIESLSECIEMDSNDLPMVMHLAVKARALLADIEQEAGA